MEGMLTPLWQKAQQEYLDSIQDQRRSAARWCAILTTKIWQLAHDMWTQRNDILHHNEEAKQKLLATTHKDQLTELYQRRDRTMPHTDLRLFRRPLEEALKLKIHEQRRLIRLLRAAVQAHDERKDNKQAQALRAWLDS